jgi:hypothetical protein
MGLLKTLLSAKAVEKVVQYIDSKNATPEYIPARGRHAPPRKNSARTAALATVGLQVARRNPALVAVVGVAALAVYAASAYMKKKPQRPTYY